MSNFLNEVADRILNYLVVASAIAAILTALAWLIIKLGGIRASVYRHMVWLYCLIGMTALPPLWLYGPKLSLAILPAKAPQVQPPARVGCIAPRTAASKAADAFLPARGANLPPQPLPEAHSAIEMAAPERPAFPIKSLLAGVWLLGFSLMLARLAVGWHRLRRICRSARRATEIARLVEMGTRRTSILLSPEVQSPVCFGILRPTVVLPRDIYGQSEGAEMRMILSHELAHVERRDYLTNILQRLIEAVFFFHPLVWYASRQLTQERELVCDNWVLAHGATATDYAQLLSSLAERGFEKVILQGVALFEGGLLRRIRSLLDPRCIRVATASRFAALACALVALISIAGFGVLRLVEGNSEDVQADQPQAQPGAGVEDVVAHEQEKSVEGVPASEVARDSRLGVDVLQPEFSITRGTPFSPLVDVSGKPVQIKYTSLDGREVDIAKMPGRVILVDFWATWCSPCIQAIPDIKRTYERYHEKGFEIIGISLDSDKGALEKTIKEKEIPWPQYFDGKGWDNRFAREYSISEIPKMWLIGKEGKVADMNVHDYALGVKVWKLLEGLPLTGHEPDTLLEDLTDEEKKAVSEFEKAYALSEGEDLKYMAPPFLPSRQVYYRYKETFQWEMIPDGPDNWHFRWSDGELRQSGMMFSVSGGTELRQILDSLAGIYPEEVEGDEELLKTVIRGDFIVRDGVPAGKIVQDFENILQRDLNLPVKMNFREVDREVIVARGTYRFTPVPGRPENEIEIYGEKLEDPYTGGGGSGDFDEFLSWVGMYINRRVVNEVENPPQGDIIWHYNHKREGSKKPDLVLQHLTEQTGLAFKMETRRVRLLFVERAE